MKIFKDFNIVLDSLAINLFYSPTYHLCCTNKTFIHRHLVKHIIPTLILVVIAETIHIAKVIGPYNSFCSSLEDLAAWKMAYALRDVFPLWKDEEALEAQMPSVFCIVSMITVTTSVGLMWFTICLWRNAFLVQHSW